MPASEPSDGVDLESLRRRIDAIDRELLGLLNRRAEVAQAIGALKRAEGSPAFRPEREAAVIDVVGGDDLGDHQIVGRDHRHADCPDVDEDDA